METAGFFDFNEALHAFKNKIEEKFFPEWYGNVDDDWFVEFFNKENEVQLVLEFDPSFSKSILKVSLKEYVNFEQEQHVRLLKKLCAFFESFDLIHLNLESAYSFRNFMCLDNLTAVQQDSTYKKVETQYDQFFIPISKNGAIMVDLLNSSYLERIRYSDDFTFKDRKKNFSNFHFEIKLDFALYPKPNITVYIGEEKEFNFYHRENFKGNILKKLYSLEEIENFYEELKNIDTSIELVNERLYTYLEENINPKFYGAGVSYNVNEHGPFFKYNFINDLLEEYDDGKIKKAEDAIKFIEKEKDLLGKTTAFCRDLFSIFEKLNFLPTEKESSFFLDFLYGRNLNFLFNQFSERLQINVRLNTAKMIEEDVVHQEGYTLHDFLFYLRFSSEKDFIPVTGKELLEKIESVVTEYRNKQRIRSLMENKQS